jgi:hypothetical protein
MACPPIRELKINEPARKKRLPDGFKGGVHRAVEGDFVVESAEDGGDGALIFKGGKRIGIFDKLS